MLLSDVNNQLFFNVSVTHFLSSTVVTDGSLTIVFVVTCIDVTNQVFFLSIFLVPFSDDFSDVSLTSCFCSNVYLCRVKTVLSAPLVRL